MTASEAATRYTDENLKVAFIAGVEWAVSTAILCVINDDTRSAIMRKCRNT